MNTYILIGAPGMGKSPFVKSFIAGRRCLVFDIQNEYGPRVKYEGQKPFNLSDNIKNDRSRYTGNDVDTFVKLCAGRRNTVLVFEESTAFFVGRTEKELRRVLINRFHTQNICMFLFHSIQAVPPFFFTVSNFVVLFKTLDTEKNIKAKIPQLLEPYLQLKNMPNGSKKIIKLI